MRKTIRLTGRRQLAQSAFEFRFADGQGESVAVLSILDPAELRGFPADAEIRVKLSENKLIRVLGFGTVGHPSPVAAVDGESFRAPSCQVRVVNRSAEREGMLLGSTRTWTLASTGEPDGILLFQPSSIAPRLWKLDIRDEGQPLLYIDESIPDAALWAKSDPVFAACVLPAVISELMLAVLDADEPAEGSWEADWIRWANGLMPGSDPPFGGSRREQRVWIGDLLESFARRHALSEAVRVSLAREPS